MANEMVPVTTRKYFAAEEPGKLASELLKRVDDYDRNVQASGRFALWARCYAYYNNGIFQDGRLNRLGDQGEYTEIYINHFRNLLTHILVMTTDQPPTYDARAANSDYKAAAETIIANGILEFYSRFKNMDTVAKQAVEDCLVFADAYVYEGWDFSLGEPVAPDLATGTIKKTGDLFLKNYTPLDVIFDFRGGQRNAVRQWYVLRDFQNKWDLVARYPELAEKILNYSDDKTDVNFTMRGLKSDSDYIPVYIFMHDKTDAMPEGRFFSFVGKDCWLMDTGLPPFYKSLPVKRLVASKQRGTDFGYSIGYDLAAPQEAVNGLYSTVITNQSTFGVQNICIPTGSNLSVTELADGMNAINYDPKQGKPEALNLTSTPPEIFEFIAKLEAVMETISGVNSVARGNPEENLKSGTALALVQSMAIKFMSGLQQSYAKLLEDLGMGLIEIMQECATQPRLIEIAGKNNQSYAKEFTKDSISNITRVTVDLGNPVARTLAGKVNMAENLLNAKLIDTPEQYIQVMTTGKLEPLIEGKQSELMLIRSENEALAAGQPIQATVIDSHHIHVMEHRSVIASPAARQDPGVVQAVVAHIQQHIDLWKQSDPAIMQMIGEPIPPPMLPPPMPGGPGPGPGGPPPAPGEGGKAPSNSGELVHSNPTTAAAAKVHPAGLPKNPLTQETANQNGGIH